MDTLKGLIQKQEIEVLINFGSGFSMYPFLLDENILHIEIDQPEIVDYKKRQLQEWQIKNILPKRNIHFIGVDFSINYQQELYTKIQSVKGD